MNIDEIRFKDGWWILESVEPINLTGEGEEITNLKTDKAGDLLIVKSEEYQDVSIVKKQEGIGRKE